MTPKEKAIQIYTKMYNEIYTSYGTDFVAKQCAIIAVDEILNDYKNYLLHANTEYKGLMYWKEVKNELEKL
jgi:hypothetical protein